MKRLSAFVAVNAILIAFSIGTWKLVEWGWHKAFPEPVEPPKVCYQLDKAGNPQKRPCPDTTSADCRRLDASGNVIGACR